MQYPVTDWAAETPEGFMHRASAAAKCQHVHACKVDVRDIARCSLCALCLQSRTLFPALQAAERNMVTIFKKRGWDAFMLHPTFGAMKAGKLAFRNGIVVMQRYRELKTSWA